MDNRNSFLSFRGLGGELLAEFLGTLILVLFGDGVVAAAVLFLGFGPANTASWVLINFGWGFAVMLGIYTAGVLTGAHINPAVTLALALRRGFPWAKVPWYMIAQVLGGFVGAAFVYFQYHTGFINKAGVFVMNASTNVFFTSPHTAAFGGQVVPIGWAFFSEVLGTALLLFGILAIVDTRNSPPGSNLAPLLIGLLVVALGMSIGPVSGYAINPARDFGPRLWAWVAGWGAVAMPGDGVGYSTYFWVPIIGPLLGGAIGAFIYDFTIHGMLEARVSAEPGVAQKGETVVDDREPRRVTESEGRLP
jgi:glycerol uptake facilitator protein